MYTQYAIELVKITSFMSGEVVLLIINDSYPNKKNQSTYNLNHPYKMKQSTITHPLPPVA